MPPPPSLEKLLIKIIYEDDVTARPWREKSNTLEWHLTLPKNATETKSFQDKKYSDEIKLSK